MVVTACNDDEDRYGGKRLPSDDGGSSGSGGRNTSGSAGKGGEGGGSAGSDGEAGGDTNPEGGNGGTTTVGGAGAGGSGEAGEAGNPAGGANEGGQGGEGNDPNVRVVFGDDYATDVSFVGFQNNAINDVSVDATTAHSGATSLKIPVPATNYTGGALVHATNQDLSRFNAVSFWAKASVAHSLNVVGLGNDGIGPNPLQAERNALSLTTDWQRFVIPVPNPSKLTAENGLFHFAEGAESAAYTIWLDDIEYVIADNLGTPVPAIATATANILVGGTSDVGGPSATYTINAVPFTLGIGASWFDYTSTAGGVATVTDGKVTGVAVGSAEITAALNGVAAGGKITVNVAEATVPTVAAPTPINLPADVISLFSNAYTNVTIPTWSADWDQANVADVVIGGSDTKLYTLLPPFHYAGVDFGALANQINATTMTHVHVDVWMPLATRFSVELVDFGANGTFEGGDDSKAAVARTGLATKTWVSLDLPLTEFTTLTARAHIAQIVLTAEPNATIYLDNVYFHK